MCSCASGRLASTGKGVGRLAPPVEDAPNRGHRPARCSAIQPWSRDSPVTVRRCRITAPRGPILDTHPDFRHLALQYLLQRADIRGGRCKMRVAGPDLAGARAGRPHRDARLDEIVALGWPSSCIASTVEDSTMPASTKPPPSRSAGGICTASSSAGVQGRPKGQPGVPPRHVRAIGAGSSPQPWVDPRVTPAAEFTPAQADARHHERGASGRRARRSHHVRSVHGRACRGADGDYRPRHAALDAESLNCALNNEPRPPRCGDCGRGRRRGPGRCVPRPGAARGRGGPGSRPRPPPSEAACRGSPLVVESAR